MNRERERAEGGVNGEEHGGGRAGKKRQKARQKHGGRGEGKRRKRKSRERAGRGREGGRAVLVTGAEKERNREGKHRAEEEVGMQQTD
jgi:hypothetical protein